MKKYFSKEIFALLVVFGSGVYAQAQNCTIKTSAGETYEVYYKSPTVIDVITDGIDWSTELSAQSSNSSIKQFFTYRNNGRVSMELTVDPTDRISFYSHGQGFYYFQDVPCALTARASVKITPAAVGGSRQCQVKEEFQTSGPAISFVVDSLNRPIRVTLPYRNEGPESLVPDSTRPNFYVGRDYGEFQTLVEVTSTGRFILHTTEMSGDAFCL